MNMKRYLRIGIVIVVIIIAANLLYSFSRKGWLEVQAPDMPQGASAQISVEQEGKKIVAFSLSRGEQRKVRAPIGGVRVSITVNNAKTIEITNIRSFSTTKLKPVAGQKRAITKLGSDAEFCPIIVKDVLYTYDCHGNGLIYKHLPVSRDRLIARQAIMDQVQPEMAVKYRDGLLGYVDPQQLGINYFNLETEAVEDLPTPAAIKDIIREEKPEIATSSNPEQSQFAYLFANANKLLIFKNLNDTNPVQVKLPSDLPKLKDIPVISMQWDNQKLVLLISQSDQPFEAATEGPVEEQTETKISGRILEYNLQGVLQTDILLPDEFESNSIFKLVDNYYAVVLQRGEVVFYYYDGKEVEQIYTFPSISNPVVSNGKLYFQDEGSIYTFEPKENGEFRLRGLFSSDDISVSEIFEGPDNTLLFTGFANRAEEEPLDVYQLLNKDQETPPLEEVLKFQSISNAFTGYDYDDRVVVFNLLHTNTPGATYDLLIEGIRKYLESKGMNTGGRAIDIGQRY